MLQDNWTRKILKKKTSAKGQPRVGQEEEAVWSSYLISCGKSQPQWDFRQNSYNSPFPDALPRTAPRS